MRTPFGQRDEVGWIALGFAGLGLLAAVMFFVLFAGAVNELVFAVQPLAELWHQHPRELVFFPFFVSFFLRFWRRARVFHERLDQLAFPHAAVPLHLVDEIVLLHEPLQLRHS